MPGGVGWWLVMVVCRTCLPVYLPSCLPAFLPVHRAAVDVEISICPTHMFLLLLLPLRVAAPKSWAIERSGGRIDGQTVHPKVCWSVHPLAHCVSRCTHMIRVGILKYKRLSNTSRRALKFKHTQIYLILEASFELEIIRFLTI